MINSTIDSVIKTIANLRNELHNLDYNEKVYDEKENRLHDLEDRLLSEHGEELYAVLKKVYEENQIMPPFLTPLAYVPRTFIKKVNNRYDVEPKAGALVDVKASNKRFYLAFVPGPLRLVLQNNTGDKEVIWISGD